MESEKSWKLEEAKARFSQVVRLAQNAPQHVTVRGRKSAVILSEELYENLRPESKTPLSKLVRESPLKGVEFGEPGKAMPVREVDL